MLSQYITNRKHSLFDDDYKKFTDDFGKKINLAKILVIGGAGSIGKSVVLELLHLDPKCLHVVDISENELVELVRYIRSSSRYTVNEFKTFCLDYGGSEFSALLEAEDRYDYIFNLAALKHVRSERDPFTLMRMIKVNVLNTLRSVQMAKQVGAVNYFCVSTDKASNPVNMMGASKKIMEMFLIKESLEQHITMARFANVAFSNGSLLHGFLRRLDDSQPLSAPVDVKRYFLTPEESGQLCLMAGLTGENMDIYFPKLNESTDQRTFADIAIKILEKRGFEPYQCSSEQEARALVTELIPIGKWPCYFFKSDTTGEKPFEEFYTASELISLEKFKSIGVIKGSCDVDDAKLEFFLKTIRGMIEKNNWTLSQLVELFKATIPNFYHLDTGKNLDQKM